MKIALICGVLFLITLYGCNYYSNSLPKCMQCIINLQETKDSVEVKLGQPIKIDKNKKGNFIATYPFTFPIQEKNSTSPFNTVPLIYKNVTHIVVMYDKNLKVKNYWFEKNTH